MDSIARLESEIIAHTEAYQAGNPTITDAAFDAKVAKLAAIKPESKALDFLGNADGDVVHDVPMLSLAKSYALDSCLEALADMPTQMYLVMDKLDGVACSLEYHHGKLVRASTRGDGHRGKDITKGIMASRHIPTTIDYKPHVELRGELVLSKADAEALSIETTPRNAVCSAVQSKQANHLQAHVRFVCYDVVGRRGNLAARLAYIERKTAIPCVNRAQCGFASIEAEITHREQTRGLHAYPCDGVVVAGLGCESIGCTKHHPLWMHAFKFSSDAVKTTITDIEIRTAKSGRRTAVIHVEPVRIDGAKVSKVAMAASRIESDGWQVGDIVDVSLKGGAVPVIARHTEHAQNAPRMPIFDDLELGGIDTQETLEDAQNGHLNANEDIDARRGDLWEYGRYASIDEASNHMQRAIDATQAEYDYRLREICKPCVWVFITRVTLDDDGELVSSESIDGAKLRHRAKTIWRVKARAYTTYKDGEIIDDTTPAREGYAS